MPDDRLVRLLSVVEGDGPSTEFVDRLRADVERELVPAISVAGDAAEEVEDVTIEQMAPGRSQRIWLLAAAVATLVGVVGIASLLADSEPEPSPPAAPATTAAESPSVTLVSELVRRIATGEREAADELTSGSTVLQSRALVIRFLGEIDMEVLDLECVEVGAFDVTCLAEVVDDWAREIGFDSQLRLTARVRGGAVVLVTELVFSDDATTEAFFGEFLPSAHAGELQACGDDLACLAGLVRSYAAEYARSDVYVEPTPLDLPDPDAG